MAWPTIHCSMPTCELPTVSERRIGGFSVRCCRSGHRGRYDGAALVAWIVRRNRNTPRCWCGAPTHYMPCGRTIRDKRGAKVRALKRECHKGHRSWFQRASDGGRLVRKVERRPTP